MRRHVRESGNAKTRLGHLFAGFVLGLIYSGYHSNLAERAMREVVKHRVMKSLLRTTEGAKMFAILLTIMMTYKNGDVLEQLKKYMARGRKSGRTEQDETSDNTSDAPDSPPDDGYGYAGPAVAGHKRDFGERGWRMHVYLNILAQLIRPKPSKRVLLSVKARWT